jgi:hypothetical protein
MPGLFFGEPCAIDAGELCAIATSDASTIPPASRAANSRGARLNENPILAIVIG